MGITIEQFQEARIKALWARDEYARSRERIAELAKSLRPVLERLTQDAISRHTLLWADWMQAYTVGQTIVEDMRHGDRWPRDLEGHTYAAMLRTVPVAQRSPEMDQCLHAWERWEGFRKEWEKLNPAPDGCEWNGPRLDIEGLYRDFGMVAP